jgi:triosephosphate isomerase
MKKILIANWKLNPQTEAQAKALAKAIDAQGVVVCPPFPFLGGVKSVLKKGALGAQNVSWQKEGAYTGEVSPTMLKKFGVKYVIVGHSERRKLMNESNEVVNKKVRAALGAGLRVVLCVGEDKEVREKGMSHAKAFVEEQLVKGLLEVTKSQFSQLMIAYEPVWAISAVSGGVSDNPDEAAEMIQHIKYLINYEFSIKNISVIYGGSVNAKNAPAFLKHKEIAGALVGGASLKTGEFRKIIASVSKV